MEYVLAQIYATVAGSKPTRGNVLEYAKIKILYYKS